RGPAPAPAAHQGTDLAGENVLIADADREQVLSECQRFIALTGPEPAGVWRPGIHDREPVPQRDVFPEGDENAFVVAADNPAGGIGKERGVADSDLIVL